MILGAVEPSGEARELAVLELEGALAALGGRPTGRSVAGLREVEVPDEGSLVRLAGRLALARRTLVPLDAVGGLERSVRDAGASKASAAFRRVGAPGREADPRLRALGAAYVAGGGTIDLARPAVRYWLAEPGAGAELLFREVAAVDRAAYSGRAMPRLPFRRPVSLAPRLARAAVNLAAVRPGETVLDPFLGTGALLAEAALLGSRVYGLDVDPAMVRGALRNLEHLGVRAEALAQGDARSVELPGAPETFDALVTDPPYGRSSASVGAAPGRLVEETLARWVRRLRPDGAVVVVSPGGPAPLAPPWAEVGRAAVRVHRSLTREFRVYRRPG